MGNIEIMYIQKADRLDLRDFMSDQITKSKPPEICSRLLYNWDGRTIICVYLETSVQQVYTVLPYIFLISELVIKILS